MSIDTLLRERAVLKDVRRVVVKVGTHAIAKKSGRPDYVALRRIVSGICALRAEGREVIFVSSGAVAAGVEALGLKSRPGDVNDIQMCAAVGQARYCLLVPALSISIRISVKLSSREASL